MFVRVGYVQDVEVDAGAALTWPAAMVTETELAETPVMIEPTGATGAAFGEDVGDGT
jgi:hypothetical protein